MTAHVQRLHQQAKGDFLSVATHRDQARYISMGFAVSFTHSMY